MDTNLRIKCFNFRPGRIGQRAAQPAKAIDQLELQMIHGVGTNQNLTLEIEALICRLLVALLGGVHADYVRSPVNTRQRYGLDLR